MSPHGASNYVVVVLYSSYHHTNQTDVYIEKQLPKQSEVWLEQPTYGEEGEAGENKLLFELNIGGQNATQARDKLKLANGAFLLLLTVDGFVLALLMMQRSVVHKRHQSNPAHSNIRDSFQSQRISKIPEDTTQEF